MPGRYLSKGARPHVCELPDRKARKADGVLPGAEWRCDCGWVWAWTAYRDEPYGWRQVQWTGECEED